MNDINPTTGLPMSGGGIDAAQIVLMMKQVNQVEIAIQFQINIGLGKLMQC